MFDEILKDIETELALNLVDVRKDLMAIVAKKLETLDTVDVLVGETDTTQTYVKEWCSRQVAKYTIKKPVEPDTREDTPQDTVEMDVDRISSATSLEGVRTITAVPTYSAALDLTDAIDKRIEERKAEAEDKGFKCSICSNSGRGHLVSVDGSVYCPDCWGKKKEKQETSNKNLPECWGCYSEAVEGLVDSDGDMCCQECWDDYGRQSLTEGVEEISGWEKDVKEYEERKEKEDEDTLDDFTTSLLVKAYTDFVREAGECYVHPDDTCSKGYYFSTYSAIRDFIQDMIKKGILGEACPEVIIRTLENIDIPWGYHNGFIYRRLEW